MSNNESKSGYDSPEMQVKSTMYHEDGTAIGLDEVIIHYDKGWWRTPHLIRLNIAIFIITLTSTTQGYDGSMLNGLQSLDKWQVKMGHPTGAILGALSNGTLFGSVFSTIFASWINDKWGRKYGIFIGEIFAVIGAVLQGASTNYAFFFCARFVLGIGGTIAVVGSAPLISEVAYPTHRPIATSMYNVCWYLGAVIASGVTYGTRNINDENCWKIPSYIQGFLPLVQVVTIWMLPESPRFLVNKGDIEKAREILRKYHVGGSTSFEANRFIDFEIEEIETALEMEKLQNSVSYKDFLKTPGNRKRLFLVIWVPIMMQLSGNGLVSYYLTMVLKSIGITSTDQQLKINVALMGYNLGMSIICACVNYRFKRRTIFLASTLLMCICYVLWTILSALNQQRNFQDKSLAQGVLAMIFFFYASYDLGLNGLPFLYITEVLTYSLRAKGINIMNGASLLATCYNGFVNPVAMNAIDWKYYIVYCCILAVEFVVVFFFFPETSGYSLEEVAQVFGDDPQDTHHVISAIKSQKHSVSHVEEV